MFEELWQGLSESLRIMLNADHRYVGLAFVSYIVSVLLYALRWSFILSRMGVRFPVKDSFLGYLMGFLVNNITPSMRAGGEVIRVTYAYLQTKAPIPTIVNSIVFERVVEAIPVAVIAVVALTGELAAGDLPLGIVFALILIVVGVFVGVKYWDRILEYIADKFRAREKLQLGNSVGLSKLLGDRVAVIVSALLSSGVWLLDVARFYFIAVAVGWDTSVYRIVLASVMYLVIGLVAFTPGGLGIVEGGLTAVFTALGAPASTALAIVMVERLISYVFASLLGGLAVAIGGGRQAWTLLRLRWRQTGSTQR
ncbi:lysylphosphatidylglycerol synthase transmembrane domain-containing protein [Hyperthermus butylicus]|uniref:Conserved archaeal protein n=1 Tax=Hyperthermus butylicus (strain DSM 5456 / JCM 9403 / PLM1-5) TaxID=415426 RepID=A2BLS8_HYPBU|nr:flippase-like domain-containing protein [Hyperthermus butylicus]ABM80939.1 conserved archaeal protein [Hyperthermus butylicus DSM 5456]